MIQIKKKKRGSCPVIHDMAGNDKIIAETNNNKILYDQTPLDYDNRIKKWVIDSSIYGHPSIKSKLRESQYGKCAFCESNVASISHGDIEHFRPKKYWLQNEKSLPQGPGYYWLAYDYDNLLFSCQVCNQRYKKNFFPVRRPLLRAINHHHAHNILKEKPFFINPLIENPRTLILFNGPEAKPRGKDKNGRAKKTIEAVGLNRKGKSGISDLYEMRLQLFQIAESTYWISKQVSNASIPQSIIDNALNAMVELRKNKSQFSAMINDNFPL